MTKNIIELTDLTKKYGSFTAVDHLNLSVAEGEVFGLLGPNGAGKSTTILMILGLTEPETGSVRVCGIDPMRSPVEVKTKVGYLPEDVGFYEKYSGLENLVYTGMLNGMSRRQATEGAKVLLDKVGLASHAEKKTGTYSKGMRQRLGLADVLIKDPRVIILDEPIMGIDPSGIREFLDIIIRLSKKENITVLFSSHQLHQVQQVCDRIGLFVNGKLIAQGDINSLSQKLSGNSPYTVEVGLKMPKEKSLTPGIKKEAETILSKMEGILTIKENEGIYSVSCASDMTSKIASTLVQAGLSVSHLVKKEYGLDDIYYQYFEGGVTHD